MSLVRVLILILREKGKEKEKIPNLLLLFYLWLLLALPLSVHRLIEVTAEPHPPTGFGNYPSALHEGASEIMGMICKEQLCLSCGK